MYTVEQVAEALNLKPTTIRTWLKEGKLKGTKVGKSWKIKAGDLRELIPEGALTEFFDFSEKAKDIAKEIYPDFWKEMQEQRKYQDECREEEYWTDRLRHKYNEEVAIRFPYPYTEKDVFARHPDGTPNWTGADIPVWEGYYEGKLKEEEIKFNKLLKLLKNKYNMKDTEIEEIQRTADNIKLLELAGFKDR